MVDRTQEDINQDVRIANLEQANRESNKRFLAMETAQRNHKTLIEAIADQTKAFHDRLEPVLQLEHAVQKIEGDLAHLGPLEVLAELIAKVKQLLKL